MLIFITGFPGSGKSFLGMQAATQLKFSFSDTDRLIEKKVGEGIHDIFKKFGEDYFRKIESEVIRSIPKNKDTIVSVGGGLPCFHDNMQWMTANGFTVYLEASAAFLFHRLVKEKSKRPLISGLSDVELMIYITETLAARRPVYEQASLKLNAETVTPARLITAIKANRKK